MESSDSPEIPDRGETSDIPGLPSGDTKRISDAVLKKDNKFNNNNSNDDNNENVDIAHRLRKIAQRTYKW